MRIALHISKGGGGTPSLFDYAEATVGLKDDRFDVLDRRDALDAQGGTPAFVAMPPAITAPETGTPAAVS